MDLGVGWSTINNKSLSEPNSAIGAVHRSFYANKEHQQCRVTTEYINKLKLDLELHELLLPNFVLTCIKLLLLADSFQPIQCSTGKDQTGA